MKERFVLSQLKTLLQNNVQDHSKIVVVSIIGKSAINSSAVKLKPLAFSFAGNKLDKEFEIEGCYDRSSQTIFLHCYTLLDTEVLLQHYNTIFERCRRERNCDDFLCANDDIKTNYAKALSLCLHISHIVVICSPSATFDINYLQYFKAADEFIDKIHEPLVETMKSAQSTSFSLDWLTNGRFCLPRVLFFFERASVTQKSIRKMEHNLQQRLYAIFKKMRLINHNSCLFSLLPNQECIYMAQPDEGAAVDRLQSLVQGLLHDCQPSSGPVRMTMPFSTASDLSNPLTNGSVGYEHNFPQFLQRHIQQAKNKHFNEHSSQHGHSSARPRIPAHFELPSLNEWCEYVEMVLELVNSTDPLLTSMCTETQFSEQRCFKVLPLAMARYQDGVPLHYSAVEHERRLKAALNLFSAQARGSAFDAFATQLITDCEKFWENRRQQCEVLSLTGQPCKLGKSSMHCEEDMEDHKSDVLYKALCDCGRKWGARDDPYTVQQANELFYRTVSKDCINCSKLETQILFPVDPSSRCVMLTSGTPSDVLPEFSSWSLLCLGSSSLYSHNLGLSDIYHPGFYSGSNFLLPWDVAVRTTSSKGWPQPSSKYGTSSSSSSSSRCGSGKTPSKAGGGTISYNQFTVKVFVGVEYECMLGHRFMMSAPDKVLKATPPGSGIVRDTGHTVAESDMPLYYPCLCRGARKMAQLMRLHVVTPKAPVHCTLTPQVQPAPGSSIFVPTHETPIKLSQSAYWIMRLPYMYEDKNGHIAQNIGGKLLKGAFGVMEAID